MRPSLIPGLVAASQRNADRGFSDMALFEVGQIFKGDRPQDQFIAASGVRRGLASAAGIGRHWSGSADGQCLDAKADALAVLAAAGASVQALQIVAGGPPGCIRAAPAPSRWVRRTSSAFSASCIRSALEALGAEGPLVAFEVILDRIPDAKAKPTRAKPLLELSAFQPVSRDFAFIVDRKVKAGDIVRAAQSCRSSKLITAVDGVRRVRRQGHRSGQEVDRHRRHVAAARKDPDRSGDRRGRHEDRRRGHEEDRRDVAGMSPPPCCRPASAIFTLAALMAVALVASVARGFSGFGSALIFMPLASTVAAPRMVAALLLIIDLVFAAPFAPKAWKQARPQGRGADGDRRAGHRADRHLRADPAQSR